MSINVPCDVLYDRALDYIFLHIDIQPVNKEIILHNPVLFVQQGNAKPPNLARNTEEHCLKPRVITPVRLGAHNNLIVIRTLHKTSPMQDWSIIIVEILIMIQEDHGVTQLQLTKDGSIVMSYFVVSTFLLKTIFNDDNFCLYKNDSISFRVFQKRTCIPDF